MEEKIQWTTNEGKKMYGTAIGVVEDPEDGTFFVIRPNLKYCEGQTTHYCMAPVFACSPWSGMDPNKKLD